MPDILSIKIHDGAIHIGGGARDPLVSACGDTESVNPGWSSGILLAASLGNCVAASLAPLLARHGYSEERLHVQITTGDGSVPEAILLDIFAPEMEGDLLARCRRAAEQCPVRRALAVPVSFNWITD